MFMTVHVDGMETHRIGQQVSQTDQTSESESNKKPPIRLQLLAGRLSKKFQIEFISLSPPVRPFVHPSSSWISNTERNERGRAITGASTTGCKLTEHDRYSRQTQVAARRSAWLGFVEILNCTPESELFCSLLSIRVPMASESTVSCLSGVKIVKGLTCFLSPSLLTQLGQGASTRVDKKSTLSF